jgi:hypothetical protein
VAEFEQLEFSAGWERSAQRRQDLVLRERRQFPLEAHANRFSDDSVADCKAAQFPCGKTALRARRWSKANDLLGVGCGEGCISSRQVPHQDSLAGDRKAYTQSQFE